MTKQIIDYPTKDLMKAGKKTQHNLGFIPLHTDFINNKESDGYRVTFVKGSDDPNNSPKAIAKREKQKIERDRTEELREKLRNRTISQPELLELMDLLL